MIKSSEHKSFYYPAFLTFIFLFLSVGIIITGFLYFENNRKQIKQNKQEEISAIADMKVTQIDSWLKERLGDTNLITDNPLFAASVYQLHNGTTDPAIKQDINNFINSFYEHYGYKGILLLDTQGNVQLSVPDFNEPIGPDDKKYISEAVRTKKVVFSDLHRENQEEGILMDLLAPLLIRRGPERIPVGVVLLRIDPHRFLYPAIQTWPTPSRSAEILLVRREGNEVVFLNELRHQKDTALKLRFPISKQHTPAIMAIQGQRGVVEGLDYRGVPVLAAIKAVPNSTWLLIAKVDTDEIYAGIRNQAGYVLILVSILIITTGIGIGFLWRQQQARFYYTQYTAERERRALTKHYEYLTKYANDIIIMHDEDGKILEVNDRALSAYGYTREELLKLNASDLRSPDSTVSNEERWEQILESKGIVFESVHRRKDGTEFPVEVSARLMTVEGKNYIQTIIRDITERKKAETTLMESEEKYRTLVERANDGIIIVQDAIVKYSNQRMADLDCSSIEQLVGSPFVDHVHPDEVHRLMENYRQRMAGESIPPIYETVLQRRDGSPVPAELNIGVILYQGRPALLAIIRDITERKQMETKLRTASLYARSLIEASIDPLVIISFEGKITDVNKATEQVTGVSREQLIGSDFSEYLTEPEKALQGFQTVITQGLVRDFPLTIRHTSGSTTDVLYNAILYQNDAGEVQGVFAAARDITERKLAEEKLREAKEQLEKFIENSIDPIVVCDRKGHVAKPNKAFLGMLGYVEEEIIGWMLHSLSVTETGMYESITGEMVTITEDLFKESSTCIQQLLETGKISNWQTYYMKKCHTIIPVTQNITLIYNDHGEVTGSFSIIRDLTHQKKAEAALRVSEEHFRAIAESSMDAIITSDTQNNIIFCNRAAERMYGYSKEELMGKPAVLLTPERLRERNKTSFKNVLEKEMPSSAGRFREVWGLRKDQQEFPTEVSVTTYKIDDKLYFTATIRDISERKQMEEQIRQSQKMEAIGTLAGGVAHDLNNVLSAMISYPELLLLNLPEDSPMRKPIVSIKSAGEKAAAIVNDLLTLARRGVTVSEVANLNTVITDYLSSSQYEKLQSYHPKVEFEINLAPDLLNTVGSPVHFSKTVMNLIANAAEAMPEGGKVTIATENQYLDKPLKGYGKFKDGEYVVLTVKDSGTGISQEDLSRIFEPFYTKKVMGRSGTGLGLAVVWGTVQDHNGYIDVDSELDKGTAFKLYFPATRKEIEVKKESLPIEMYSGHGEHILVVDDIESQRGIASNILTKLNYRVETVASGEEAVEYLKSKPVDLVILDMIMDPGIDGLETYKRISTIAPHQKAIIASGFAATERVKEAQRLGAGTYIKKPYIMGEIGMAVKNELSQ